MLQEAGAWDSLVGDAAVASRTQVVARAAASLHRVVHHTSPHTTTMGMLSRARVTTHSAHVVPPRRPRAMPSPPADCVARDPQRSRRSVRGQSRRLAQSRRLGAAASGQSPVSPPGAAAVWRCPYRGSRATLHRWSEQLRRQRGVIIGLTVDRETEGRGSVRCANERGTAVLRQQGLRVTSARRAGVLAGVRRMPEILGVRYWCGHVRESILHTRANVDVCEYISYGTV